ncbi:actin-like protein Arp5p [Ceratobasidium sp. AG-I]|nr:actin-like protein Arp5p [Ceratobasidium sp. AG-I]
MDNDRTLFIAAHNGGTPEPMVPFEYSGSTERVPIVIDNGATNFRYGFAGNDRGPSSWLNSVSRYRERKTNRPVLLFGESTNIDATSRAQSKQPWEGDLLLNFDALENALDHAFIHLGIDTPSVEHPIFMTERLASPLHSRALTSELLFEAYGVPSVAYGIDSLMSLHYNSGTPNHALTDSLVVSFNASSTSVIPIYDGRALLGYSKRIPYGGSQASELLLKLAQVKYPTFPAKVSKEQCTTILHNICEVAPDFTEKLRELSNPEKMLEADRVVQFPFVSPVETEKSEEELARQAEKRREAGRRLQEMAIQKRLEKLIQKENDLQELQELREWKNKEKKTDFQHRLRTEGFDAEEMLDSTIKKLENDLKKARKKEGDANDDVPQEEPTYPLLDVPDAELDEDELKEKRRQKLLKAGYDARVRARKEKEAAKKEKEEEERRELEERTTDPTGWAAKLREDHELLVEKLKTREKRKAALADRKSAANMNRMKNIASLASDEPQNKKRKKGGNNDMFGANDDDWAIYRKINVAVESSDEEEDTNQLTLLESKLLQHDPSFSPAHTYAAIKQQKSALLTAFRPSYDHPDPDPNPGTRTRDVEGEHRLHFNVERWRVPEVWFQPGIAGVDAAGLGETMASLLPHTRCGQIFLTGGPALTKGMRERVELCVRPLLDPDMPVVAVRAKDPELDAWRGMSRFASTEEFKRVMVTKAEYEEWGGERIRRWWGGNWNNAF